MIDRELGLKRLGAILRLSRERQRLSMIELSTLTKQIFNGEGINKNTLSQIERGNILNPEEFTLFRLAPLTLRVSHIVVKDKNDIGKPFFTFARDFMALENLQLRNAQNLEQLPKLEYRYKRKEDLWAIVDGELPIVFE